MPSPPSIAESDKHKAHTARPAVSVSPTATPATIERRHWLGLVAIALLTALLYSQTARFDFVGFDDEDYVIDNPWVNQGLSAQAVTWAATAFHSGNWHPLTWMSHMLDCQLWGLAAGGHHLTSAALHVLNVALLFVVWARLAGRPGVALAAAALFAVHPLRAESVAWVSERKDVLSLTFGLLAIGAYDHCARRPSLARYLAVFALFAAGLAAKPVLVTLPCVFWLLDYWPLGRWSFAPAGSAPRADWQRLIAEKVPLFALVAGSSWLTVRAQAAGAAFSDTDVYPLGERLANSLVAYATYLEKLAWPTRLYFVYPRTGNDAPGGLVALSALLLVALTLACLAQWRRRPYLVVGWLWFLGTLVPNIGLVQVGPQLRADRFTYLSSIGLTVALCALAAEALSRRPRATAWVITTILVLALAPLSWAQIGTWRSTDAMIANALGYDPDNYIAQRVWGSVLIDRGELEEGIAHLKRAVEVNGRPMPQTMIYLAGALEKAGQRDEAMSWAQRALELRPKEADAHRQVGKLLLAQGDVYGATAALRKATALDPRFGEAHNDLAIALARQGNLPEALAESRRAVDLRPRNGQFLSNMGALLMRGQDLPAARRACEAAIRFAPRLAEAHHNLGLVLWRQGQPEPAQTELNAALELDPGLFEVEYDQAGLELSQGRVAAAATRLRALLVRRPDWLSAKNDLAWILATARDETLRDSETAVRLAEEASRQSPVEMPELLDTLSAAYAAAGRFDDACRTATRGRQLATEQGNRALAEGIAERLKQYQAGRPLRAT